MTTTPQHEVIPAALAEYCESVRQRRMRPLLAAIGSPSVFEAVIKEHVATHKEKSSGTLKEQIKDIITRTVKEPGNKTHAAKRLGISRMTVQAYTKGLAVLLLAISFQPSAFSQPKLLSLPQTLAAAPAVSAAGFSGQLALTWDVSSNAVRYAVSYGTNRAALNQSIGVGSKTNVTIKGLAEAATYYFAAYSYDTNGVESLPSNMVTNFIQPKMTLTAASYAVSMTLPRRTNVIESSTNMSTWRAIHTNTTGGIVTVTRPALASGEFFRVR